MPVAIDDVVVGRSSCGLRIVFDLETDGQVAAAHAQRFQLAGDCADEVGRGLSPLVRERLRAGRDFFEQCRFAGA
ncbi:MAG: hypothetical protein U5Q44_01640 [Dehalococcoidia bacterium]|nr:hypothetical protein [Dehalococcoidia bacterium]